MTSETQAQRTRPATWVPTLYFAEGLPFFAVNFMALIFYQRMGVSNALTTAVVSMLAWPWTLKPIWSPLLEMYWTKKRFVVLMQVVAGVGLMLLALSLPLPGYFRWSIAILTVLAFASSTHDIAADGIYITSLSKTEQADYVGWQGAFYNAARIFSMSALVWLVGALQNRFTASGAAAPMTKAWMAVFAGLGVLLVLLGLYHARMLPSSEERHTGSLGEAARTFGDVVVTFFQKPSIWLLLVFIFLFRAGEGQVIKVGPLFLQADRAQGGLGLTLQQFGTTYGAFGSVAFILGSILGGYFTARFGLRRALLPLMCILNLPMLAYWYLSVALPASATVSRASAPLLWQLVGHFEGLTGVPAVITLALTVEMFGYGFGFVGIILLMMQEIAPGKYQTAHYAFANSLMNLGVILPGAVSGWIQTQIGYRNFFLWVVLASIPALVLSRFIPIRGGAEKAEPPAHSRGGPAEGPRT
jgi:PAT family beta-lactamase induction signal transducer AmpG